MSLSPRKEESHFTISLVDNLCVIGNPLYLLVPTQKNNEGIPDTGKHYKCYEVVAGESPEKKVTIKDQFDIEPMTTIVGNPRFFCTPVRKNNESISEEDRYRLPKTQLVFYDIEMPMTAIISVDIHNQFLSYGTYYERSFRMRNPEHIEKFFHLLLNYSLNFF